MIFSIFGHHNSFMDLKRNRKDLKEVRRSLRSNATSSEAVLWSCLSGSKLDGRKFRRQHSIGLFVLDFYCPSERLCVELDGSIHHDPTASLNDQWRDEQLKAAGIRTVRIENDELLANLDGVLELIRKNFR